MVTDRLRRFVKEHPILARLHWWISLLRTIPAQEFLSVSKIRVLLTAAPYSQCSVYKLSALYETALSLERENIEGSFVECGVRNGGSAGVMATPARNNPGRHVWLFDSWQGLAEPSGHDIDPQGRPGKKGQALGEIEKATELILGKLRLDATRIHLVRGWFNETLPLLKDEIGEVALLNVDCDWYESVKFCLEQLYDSVAEGGFVFLDDYFYWQGCRKAVDEFVSKHPALELVRVDRVGVCFQKREARTASQADALCSH